MHRLVVERPVSAPPPPPPPPPTGNILFTPGHWCTPDRGSGGGGQSGQLSFVNSVKSSCPYIKGVVLAGRWGEYDGGTSSANYTIGEQLLDAWVNQCVKSGLQLLVRFDWSEYSASTPTTPLGCCPSWFVQNSATQPAYTLRPSGTTWAGNLATSAEYWYKPTMDAYIDMVAHFANRYANVSNFEGFRFPETASAVPTSAGNTTPNASAQFANLFANVRSAAPTKEISIAGNYFGGDTDTLAVITNGMASKVLATAGPDAGPSRSFQFNAVFNGWLSGSKTGTDYRGKFPVIVEEQYPDEADGSNSQSTTPALLYNWAFGSGTDSTGGNLNPNKYIWQVSTYTGPAPSGFNYFVWSDVVNFINSISGKINTVRPAGY